MGPFLQNLLFVVRFMGVRSSIDIAQSTATRNRLNKKYPPGWEYRTNRPLKPGVCRQAKPTPRGGEFSFGREFSLHVEFLTPELIHLTWLPGKAPANYALVEQEWPALDLKWEEGKKGWRISSDKLSVCINRQGKVDYIVDGKVIREEFPPTLDAAVWQHVADIDTRALILGMGERASNLNLRGGEYRLWNQDPGGSYGLGKDPIYLTIPLYHHLAPEKEYLVFYNNSHDGTISFDEQVCAEFSGGALSYYFFLGHPAKTVRNYTQLTGRSPLPPRWALGFHQSRWGYKSEQDIREVAAGFKDHGLPIQAIHLDIDYMDGYRVFSVDQNRYPDLEKLSKDMEAQGIKLVTIIDPGVKLDSRYQIYQEGLDQEVYLKTPSGQVHWGVVWPGRSVFPDFTNPDTRKWWGGLYPRLIDQGISGFWHDMNEPVSFTKDDSSTLPYSIQHDMDGQGGDHQEGHNLYGMQMNHAGFEGIKKYLPDKRPWLLTRSGWAGVQRYAWKWTGDVESSWPALKMTISTVLNLGLSGIPYSGPDIGGFSGSPSAELFTRWFQMAAFLPFFRNHTAWDTPRTEPWVFGAPTLEICRDFLNQRARLMPYLYTLAWQANQFGAPLVRPLFWQSPDQPDLHNIDDIFMLGDDILIAPVVEKGAVSREVTLPEGTWYSYWDARKYKGGQAHRIPVSLHFIPVFVSAGSVIPIDVDGEFALQLYPPEDQIDSKINYHFADEGDGYEDSRLDQFQFRWKRKKLTLTWEFQGDYPRPEGVRLYCQGHEIDQVSVDGEKLAWEQGLLVPSFKELKFTFKKKRLE